MPETTNHTTARQHKTQTPKPPIRAPHKPNQETPTHPATNTGNTENVRTGLQQAMHTLDLSHKDMAALIGTDSDTVKRWLHSEPPTAPHLPKITVIIKIADTLKHKLRPGLPREVVRKPAEAYNNQTMLDLITANKHEWLHKDLQAMFDYSTTA